MENIRCRRFLKFPIQVQLFVRFLSSYGCVVYKPKQRYGRGGIPIDSTTYGSLLQGCGKMKALTEGKRVHAQIVETGFEMDIFVRNHLVNMYAKCGSIENARQVFDKMPERNFVSWTAMITGYAQNEQGEEAIKLFAQMLQTGVKVNQFTLSSVLGACADLASLEQGKQDISRMDSLWKPLNFFGKCILMP